MCSRAFGLAAQAALGIAASSTSTGGTQPYAGGKDFWGLHTGLLTTGASQAGAGGVPRRRHASAEMHRDLRLDPMTELLDAPRRRAARGGATSRVFRATEEENRRAILRRCPPAAARCSTSARTTARSRARGAQARRGHRRRAPRARRGRRARGVHVIGPTSRRACPSTTAGSRWSRQPDHRARAPHGHLPRRDPPRARPRRHRLHLDEQPRRAGTTWSR